MRVAKTRLRGGEGLRRCEKCGLMRVGGGRCKGWTRRLACRLPHSAAHLGRAEGALSAQRVRQAT